MAAQLDRVEPATSPRTHAQNGPGCGWLIFGGTILAVVADLVSKRIIETWLQDRPGRSVEIAGRFVQFELAENRGVSFGLFGDRPGLAWILVAFGLIATLAIAMWAIPSSGSGITVALGAIAGGGLANAVDRLGDGSVVDFVAVGPWPSFNVADASITLGVLLLLLLLLRGNSIPA
jgi:signal peptidase II